MSYIYLYIWVSLMKSFKSFLSSQNTHKLNLLTTMLLYLVDSIYG